MPGFGFVVKLNFPLSGCLALSWVLVGFGSGHCLFLLSFSFLFRLCSLFGELRFLLSSSFKD